jgi:hypothetical protein
MAVDLESVRKEMEEFLAGTNLAVFRGVVGPHESRYVYWDIVVDPDFRCFVKIAEKAGVRLIVLTHDAFLLDEIDDVREELEQSSLAREEKRALELRIAELQKYEGFTSRLELSFSLEGCIYLYRLEADWYGAWEDIMAELDANIDDEEMHDDDGMSGYFSTN